ncbi:mCG1027121 [Mus musculus]|nr:mCG1027121 [Mus musculus]
MLLRMNLLPSAKSGWDKFNEDHFLFVAVVPVGVLWLWTWVVCPGLQTQFRVIGPRVLKVLARKRLLRDWTGLFPFRSLSNRIVC